MFWLTLAPDRLARTCLCRSATLLWFLAVCFAALLLPVAEWSFWEEFGARFNVIAVDYLRYTHEVLATIWLSYPTGKLLLALALAAAALTAIVARRRAGRVRSTRAIAGHREGPAMRDLQKISRDAALQAFTG